MTADVPKTSAKIYQFPVGGRRALADKRDDNKTASEVRSPAIMFGSGWYHDEAIQEAKRVRER